MSSIRCLDVCKLPVVGFKERPVRWGLFLAELRQIVFYTSKAMSLICILNE